jgi:hypothetical protein
MLVRLPGEFMSGSMITFVVGDRGGSVGVDRKVVELGGSIVGALWHSVILPSCSPSKNAACLRDLWRNLRLWLRNARLPVSAASPF